MALINKDKRQSVFDFLLEKTGAISGLFEFLNKNNLTDVDVPEGEYVMNDVVKKEVVNFFASISPEVSIATGAPFVIASDSLQWVLRFRAGELELAVDVDLSNIGVFASGIGSNVGTVTISTDGVTYEAIVYPFNPVVGTYYFQRSNGTDIGKYKMNGI